MASPRDRREKRTSLARRRAETHASGFEGTNIRIPDGLKFWEPKEGVYTVAIIPYTVKKGNPNAEPGDSYYERTYWQWNRIGPGEGKSYCCLHKTFGKADPIADYKTAQARNPSADQAKLQALVPKERQLFLVYDKKEGQLYLWEVSYHLFGKLLDSRIQNSDEDLGWDWFYYTDDTGMWLRLTFEEGSGGGFSWLSCTAIDFIPRKDELPEAVVNHSYCLDDLLVEKSYSELQKIFLCEPADGAEDGDDDDDDEPTPRKSEAKSETKKAEAPSKKAEEKKPAKTDDEAPFDDDPPPRKTEAKAEPKKEEKKPTFTRGDQVNYKGKCLTVLKISGDGTSLTLEDEASDEIIRAVDPAEVTPWVEKKKEEKKSEAPPKKEEKKSEAPKKESSKKDEDDDWDWEE